MEKINVDRIGAHPNNPRKALGDIGELTDSIRQNGVLQNLTVVHWHDAHPDQPKDGQPEHEYTCVIGHRRLAAAKAAGLETVPCVVAELGYREQLATMLLENIQRSDLTVIEQAQGFQMMMDLGENVKWIAQQTGFSEKTVRQRLKLNDLNQKKLQSSLNQGATLMQLVELDKVEDKKLCNELLQYGGTDNFNIQLKRALQAQASKKNKIAWLERLGAFATEIEERSWSAHEYVDRYDFDDDPAAFQPPKGAKPGQYVYVVEERKFEYDRLYATLYKVRAQVAGKTGKEIADQQASRESAIRRAKREANKVRRTMYQLRLDFVKQVGGLKKNLPLILDWLVQVSMGYPYSGPRSNINTVDLLQYPVPEGKQWRDYKEEAFDKAREHELERAVWVVALANYGDCEENGFHSGHEFPYHRENIGLALFYKLLVALGYGMSDEEKQMMGGSHPLLHAEETWKAEQAQAEDEAKAAGKAKGGRKGKVA